MLPQDFLGRVLFLLNEYGFSLLKGAAVTMVIAIVCTFFGCIIGFAVGIVQTIPLEKECTVAVDVHYLQRALDNLFGNIEKHADKGKKVTVMVRWENEQLMIDLVNGVPQRPNPVESTKIGLQTCRKIIQDMGGLFETQLEDGKFLAEIALPCVKEERA